MEQTVAASHPPTSTVTPDGVAELGERSRELAMSAQTAQERAAVIAHVSWSIRTHAELLRTLRRGTHRD